MRSLGEFFGHVARGFTAPVKPGERRVVGHEVREQTARTPDGTVTLRRTTVEEVEIRRDPPGPAPGV